ncbi:phosphotransferase [Sediminibacillus massiliensis]|uniref:phosphotransferase n=1 Tax=Sediminibacillus massiliensis TaxID=1926277 RepID=UPI0009885533|nr:phosphotransferase [Sediminibacillus massiliensis]
MEDIRFILQAFHVIPTDIVRVTDRLYKIHTPTDTFALKRSRLHPQSLSNWRSAYQNANKYRFDSIVPVYLTNDGEIYLEFQQDFYYLSPWIEQVASDEPKHDIEAFYHEISYIHQQTKQERKLPDNFLEQSVLKEKENVFSGQAQLLESVETFEQRRYMSPFELQVCTHYRDLLRVYQSLDEWYELYLEDESKSDSANVCLCHGNLRSSHIINRNSKAYFVNWEHSFHGSPMHDLALFYYQDFQYHDSLVDELIQSFYVYEKRYPLLQSERSLLAIYLLNPQPYLNVVNDYQQRTTRKSQPFQLRSLEQSYRRLMNGLNMQEFLRERREEIIEQEEMAEED